MTRITYTPTELDLARGWLHSDTATARGDVRHLGRDAAAVYNLGLAHGNADERYHAITLDAMRAALNELMDEG